MFALVQEQNYLNIYSAQDDFCSASHYANIPMHYADIFKGCKNANF